MLTAFKKIDIDDRATSKFQDNVEQSLNQITGNAILDGILLKNILLVSGSINNVSHKLGRAPRFWIVARKNANSDIWENTANTNSTFLSLNCSANCTVSLWVG